MIIHNLSAEGMEEMRRREVEEIRRRFRLVLQDIEELRPNKIILQCIHPLPRHYWMFDDWQFVPDHYETNFYEGAFRIVDGHLFWPMKRTWRGYTEKAYHLDDFDTKQLKMLWHRRFHFR